MTEMKDLPGELDSEQFDYSDIEAIENQVADWESLLDTEPRELRAYNRVVQLLENSLVMMRPSVTKDSIIEAIVLVRKHLNPGKSLR